jgi:hypothetical protein
MIFPSTQELSYFCLRERVPFSSLLFTFASLLYRLDRKRKPYDLVWEDERFLSGKVNTIKLYFDWHLLFCVLTAVFIFFLVPVSVCPQSFYLPGSVDANDKQMEQWNVKPPPLYLWSRPDWADKHKLIAQEHGHLRQHQHDLSRMESFDMDKSSARHTMDDLVSTKQQSY